MDYTILVLAICFIISLLIAITFIKLKRKKFIKLNSLLIEQNYQQFDSEINSLQTKFFFNKHEKLTFLINRALMTENESEINNLIEVAIKNKMPNNKLTYLLMGSFNYYISKKNQKQSSMLLNLIKKHGNAKIIEEAEIMYSIYILKNDNYLEILLDRIEERDVAYRGVDEFLISEIYKNKNEHKLAKKYEDLAKEHLEMLDKMLSQKHK